MRSRDGLDHASRPAPHAVPQEALTNPGRLRRSTAPAPRGARQGGRRCEGAGRRGGEFGGGVQWSIRRRRRATLMRHEVDDGDVERGGVIGGGVMAGVLLTHTFAAPLSPAARTRRVGQAAGATALVTASGRTPRLQARRARTRSAAVALATVAATAQQHLRAATRAHEQAGGMVDQLPAPREDSRGQPAGCGAVLRRRHLRHTLRSHPASTARCRARRSVPAATRKAGAVPAYHSGTVHVVPYSPSSAAHQSTRPARPAALQGGRPGGLPPRGTISPKTPPRRQSPAAAHQQNLDRLTKNRHLVAE